jgi:succinate dehydrogenase / fumarate reductase flavoprotein subunit
LLDFLSQVEKDEMPDLSPSYRGRIYNKEIIDALELENMITLLRAAGRSALFRTESRGVHFREDFPDCDNDKWMRESVLKKGAGGYDLGTRDVTVLHMSPPTGRLPYLEMIRQMMASHTEIGGHH